MKIITLIGLLVCSSFYKPFTMKKLFYLMLALGFIIHSCSSPESDPCDSQYCLNDGTCINGSCFCPLDYEGEHCETRKKGKVIFWERNDGASCTLSTGITINGQTKYITDYSVSAPSCASVDAPVFELTPGTYTYTATCGTNASKQGTISISAGACTSERIDFTFVNGSILFWTQSDLGCGNITVNIGGQSKTLDSYHSGAPACGASGAATFNLAPGTYAYTASCAGLNWSGNVTVSGGQCTKQQLVKSGSGGGGSATGQAVFWIGSSLFCGNINVSVGGQSKTFSSDLYYSSAPDCGASAAATFTLAPGTYAYTASCSGLNWSGNVTVIANNCSKTQLLNYSGGGGSTTGQALFWLASDLGCGNINVTVAGQSKAISTYSTSGTPACGAGGATFTLAPGTYAYTASCTGENWSGNVTITANGCSKIQLTSSSGGGGSANCNWNAAVNCIQVTRKIGVRCGDSQSVEITYKNICTQKIKVFTCLQKIDGTWSEGADGTFDDGFDPGASHTSYVCKGTGEYKIFAMSLTAYLQNACAYPNCN